MRQGFHKRRSLLTILFMVAFIWICIVGGQVWCNTLERDEGYLNAAATLVARGQTPYLDFIFPQQPFYPFVYGLLFKLTTPSLLAARILSAVFYVFLVTLMAQFMLRLRADKVQAVWAAVFLAFNTLGLFWYTKGKHYICADVLLFTAFLLVTQAKAAGSDNRSGNGGVVLAGACAAAAVQVRILLAPAAMLLAGTLLLSTRRPYNWKSVARMGIGAFLAGIPNLLIFLRSPADWLFNNTTLQLATRPLVNLQFTIESMGTALWRFSKLPENATLLSLCLLGLILKSASSKAMAGERLALLMAAVLSLAFFIPTPTYRQYWVEALPYLVIAATRPWCRLSEACLSRLPSKNLALVGLLFLVVFIGGYRAAGRILYSQHWHPEWGLGHYLQFKAYIESENGSASGGRERRVLTWWPGYLVADGLSPYPGSELGRPCYRAIGRLSKREMRDRGMLHPIQAKQAMARQQVDIVILGPDSDPRDERWLKDTYRRAAAFGRNRVYFPKMEP